MADLAVQFLYGNSLEKSFFCFFFSPFWHWHWIGRESRLMGTGPMSGHSMKTAIESAIVVHVGPLSAVPFAARRETVWSNELEIGAVPDDQADPQSWTSCMAVDGSMHVLRP
jgi:hypothetical protein